MDVDGCLGLDMVQEVLFKCRILYEEIYYRAAILTLRKILRYIRE